MNTPDARGWATPPDEQAAAHAQLIARALGHAEAGRDIPCTGPNRNAWTGNRETDMGPAVDQCHGCPVLTECADYALEHAEPAGVWGGLTPGRRTELRAAVHPAAAA